MAAAGVAPARARCLATSSTMSVVLSGLGLLTDTYDLQVINLARPFIAEAHAMRPADEAMITSAAIVGAISGMVAFGALADRLGRRAIFITTAVLTTAGAFGAACAAPTRFCSLFQTLALCRFVMGMGIGGEYPLSAANTAEHSHARGGRQLALTFSMMGWGGLLAPCVFMALKPARLSAGLTWRLGFAFGGLLSLVGVALRVLLLAESSRFVEARRLAEATRELDVRLGLAPRVHSPLSIACGRARAVCAYARPLLGASLCWALFDVYEYGLNMYTSDIAAEVFQQDSAGPMDPVLVVFLLRLMTLPGYFLGVLLIGGVLGRRRTLSCGFSAMGVCLCALGGLWKYLGSHGGAFMALFGLSQVCNYAGAAVATYVIAAELFPSEMRATCHGTAAASGKLGAVVGSAAFPLLAASNGLASVFWACAVVCALGLLASELLLPEYDDAAALEVDAAHARGELHALLYGARATLLFAGRAHGGGGGAGGGGAAGSAAGGEHHKVRWAGRGGEGDGVEMAMGSALLGPDAVSSSAPDADASPTPAAMRAESQSRGALPPPAPAAFMGPLVSGIGPLGGALVPTRESLPQVACALAFVCTCAAGGVLGYYYGYHHRLLPAGS